MRSTAATQSDGGWELKFRTYTNIYFCLLQYFGQLLARPPTREASWLFSELDFVHLVCRALSLMSSVWTIAERFRHVGFRKRHAKSPCTWTTGLLIPTRRDDYGPLALFPSAGSGQALAKRGEEFISERHSFGRLRTGSQTPGKGAMPLCTPLFHQPVRKGERGEDLGGTPSAGSGQAPRPPPESRALGTLNSPISQF